MLEKRELDLIVDSFPINSSKDDITIVDLFEVDNCFVASSKYAKLINNNSVISINDLSNHIGNHDTFMHYAFTICLDPKMKLQNILLFPKCLVRLSNEQSY